MIKSKKQNAFSMVEMMLLLLIASLIVVASAPIITKRHLHLPSVANHGSYMCYYQDNQLHEVRQTGKKEQKMMAGYPRTTEKCVFEPPANATMFQITAIGGGGGGGDAGSNIKEPNSYTDDDKSLSPFDLNKQKLKNNVEIEDTEEAEKEVLDLLGEVWAFARGYDSGKNYYIDYVSYAESDTCPTRPTTCTIKVYHPAEYYGEERTYTEYSYVTKTITRPCNNYCRYAGQQNCCTGNIDEEITEIVSTIKPCSNGIQDCVKKDAYYTDKPVDCESGCDKNFETDKFIVPKRETDKTQYTEGKALVCTTQKVKVEYGITYIPRYSEYTDSLLGDHVNKYSTLISPYSFCGDENSTGACGPSSGKDLHQNSAPYVSISKTGDSGYTYMARSNNAPEGAKGNMLEQDSKDVQIAEGVYKTFYFDKLKLDSGSDGTDGTCYVNEEENYENKDLGNCSAPNSYHVGYCLRHHYNEDELNGMYEYNITTDSNSLPKGNPGEAGEYKTIIVRSLNSTGKDIVIGRGGSSATLRFGQEGSDGSPTSFGDIITAQGGKGGSGSQESDVYGKLPFYNGTSFDYENLQKCFTTNELNSDAQCQAWKNDPDSIPFYRNTSSGNEGTGTVQTIVGGMFSFILKSINSTGNNNIINDLLKYAGKGGQGGGVEHFCWAGQHKIMFEGKYLKESSVFWENDLDGVNVPDEQKIPVGCKNAYRMIPAGSGYDGALIITW